MRLRKTDMEDASKRLLRPKEICEVLNMRSRRKKRLVEGFKKPLKGVEEDA